MRRYQLQSYEDRRLGGESQSRQILAGQVQLYSFPQVAGDLVERRSLGDDGDLKTLSHISGLVSGSNHGLDRSLKHL